MLTPLYLERDNWRMDTQKIVTELLATGLTQKQLADLAGCGQPAINAFSKGNRGKRPSFSIGQRLCELHRERCPAVAASVSLDTPR